MFNRDDAIQTLIDDDVNFIIDCTNSDHLVDLLYLGMKGYKNFTDEELMQELSARGYDNITSLESMWAALEAYQPYAEKHGFGDDWKRMTTERTADAAGKAAEASRCAARGPHRGDAQGRGRLASWHAAAAASTVWVALGSAEPDYWARSAIKDITRAVEQESKKTA